MEDIIEDLKKIYMNTTDSYNPKIHQTINDKYTLVDKSMLTLYLFIKIIEDRKEKNQEITDVISNYLLKQVIYEEVGNLAFEISNKSKVETYHSILDKLILEKFQYKNRITKKLKYNYTGIGFNKYSELLIFLENIADFAIFQKIILRGNQKAISFLDNTKSKLITQLKTLEPNDYFYKRKKR